MPAKSDDAANAIVALVASGCICVCDVVTVSAKLHKSKVKLIAQCSSAKLLLSENNVRLNV